MLLNELNESFVNFLWDTFVSSSSCKEVFYKNEGLFDTNERESLLKPYLENVSVWKKLYDERVSYLRDNVCLQFADKRVRAENIDYHPRFGWILRNGDDKAFLGKASVLENVKVNIGRRSYFSGPGTLRGNESISIGSYCAIAEGSYINSSSDAHPVEYPSVFGFKDERRLDEDGLCLPVEHKRLFDKRTGITIGNDVWLCRNVRILNGVSIGDGCVIAENAFVNKDCEPYGIYGGIPARLIRFRFPEKAREELLELQWWNWDYGKIKENCKFFDTDLNMFHGSFSDVII